MIVIVLILIRQHNLSAINPLSAKEKSESESDFMLAHASPSGFVVPYNFSIITLTCGFAFTGTCFHMVYTPHLALKGLKLFLVL